MKLQFLWRLPKLYIVLAINITWIITMCNTGLCLIQPVNDITRRSERRADEEHPNENEEKRIDD